MKYCLLFFMAFNAHAACLDDYSCMQELRMLERQVQAQEQQNIIMQQQANRVYTYPTPQANSNAMIPLMGRTPNIGGSFIQGYAIGRMMREY